MEENIRYWDRDRRVRCYVCGLTQIYNIAVERCSDGIHIVYYSVREKLSCG